MTVLPPKHRTSGRNSRNRDRSTTKQSSQFRRSPALCSHPARPQSQSFTKSSQKGRSTPLAVFEGDSELQVGVLFHGTADRFAPYYGGSSPIAPKPFLSIPTWT